MRQFYGRLAKCVLSAGKIHVHKIPRFRGGGILGLGGGGCADFIFMGARLFLTFSCTRSSYGLNCRDSRGSLRNGHFMGLGRTYILVYFSQVLSVSRSFSQL